METEIEFIKLIGFSILSWIVISVCFWIALKKMALIPGKVQNLLEFILEFIYELADGTIGSHEEAKPFYPLFTGIFFFVLVSNLIGLIPGTLAPTANINTTLALSLVVFVYYNFLGLKKQGFHYIGAFFGHIDLSVIPGPMKIPMAIFGYVLIPIIEVLSQLNRPFSLALRLFGNMVAKETLLGILAMLIGLFISFDNPFMKVALTSIPLILAPLIIVLGCLVSLIQACVFLFLTILYIAGAVQKAH